MLLLVALLLRFYVAYKNLIILPFFINSHVYSISCVKVRAFECVHVCKRVFVSLSVCVCVCVRACEYVCVCDCVCVCVYVLKQKSEK